MGEDGELEVRPEPPDDEREAIRAALAGAAPEQLDAWARAALREASDRDPSA